VFAAGARHRAGNMVSQTELGCQLLCGLSAQQAADLCEETLRGVPNVSETTEPDYEAWRRLIRTYIQLGEDLSENLPVNSGRSVQPQVAQRTVALSNRKEA
jgi:hypothetical protein